VPHGHQAVEQPARSAVPRLGLLSALIPNQWAVPFLTRLRSMFRLGHNGFYHFFYEKM
jgi:hypothetical protein